MKILALSFKNINCLAGEHHVDFTLPPIADAGVFAITGVNGAGKTSILDAITLGLYGETFRFDRPAHHVMTRHTADCRAQVQFALAGGRYQASWQVRRADGRPEGEAQAPEMRLQCLDDGALLATGQAQVCAQMARLTGMDFRSFTRSVLLAQGDFAAFLNALASERLAILEKMAGGDIYADYRQEIADRHLKAQAELAATDQELAGLGLLEPGQVAAYEQDWAEFNDHHQQLQAEYGQLGQQQAMVEAIADLQGQLAAKQGRLAQLAARREAIAAELDRIAANPQALTFSDGLAAAAAVDEAIAATQATLATLGAEQARLRERLALYPAPAADGAAGASLAEQQAAIAELSGKLNMAAANHQAELALAQSLSQQVSEKQALLANVGLWLEQRAADDGLLAEFPEVGRLKKLRAEVAELGAEHKRLARLDKKITRISDQNQAALAKANKQRQALEQSLAQEQQALQLLLKNGSPEQLAQWRTEQQERVQAFKDWHGLAAAYKHYSKPKGGWFSTDKTVTAADVEQTRQTLAQVEEELAREQNILRTLEQSRLFEILYKKLSPERVHLQDGKPCPLCGSPQHPYALRPPVIADPLKAVADQQLKIRGLQAAAERLKTQLGVGQKMLARSQVVSQHCQELQSQWLLLGHRLNAAASITIKDLAAIETLLAEERQQLWELSELIESCHGKQSSIGKLQRQLADNAEQIAAINDKQQRLLAATGEQTQSYQALSATLAARQQEEQALAATIARQLAALGEKMPEAGREDALFDRLNARRQEYYGYVFRKKSLVEELEGLAQAQADCGRAIKHQQELADHYNEQLLAAESVGLQLALAEKRALVANNEQLLVQRQAERQTLTAALHQQLAASGYHSLAEVRALLDSFANKPTLESSLSQVRAQLAALEAEIAADAGELAKLRQSGQALPTLAELKLRANDIAEKMDIAKLELRRLEAVLDGQARLRQRRKALEATRQQQQQAAEACAAEAVLLNADQGLALRRQAQARLAEKLLRHANALLERLSGRYYLRQQADGQGLAMEQGLALEMEDSWQGGARRSPRTLSGGETFVVSLALALALSELANNGKAMESLFLDEGFGNLDAESLHTVIATLESLKNHGKTVGLISHVEAVQKRIKAQLQVVKKANGLGELRAVAS